MTGEETVANVPEHLAKPLAELTQTFCACLGEELVSVILYGGAARGEHQAGRSDTNLLVVLRRVRSEQLRAIAREVRRARKRIKLSPVFLSQEELTASADTFAVELVEMQEQHVVLYGEDPLMNLRIDPEHVRHQVEHELRGKLSRLRQNYLRDAEDSRAVIWLMMNSLNSFLTQFAALVQLKGKRPSRKRSELVSQAAAEFDLDQELLERLLAARRGEKAIPKAEAHILFERYMGAVELTVRGVDRAKSG